MNRIKDWSVVALFFGLLAGGIPASVGAHGGHHHHHHHHAEDESLLEDLSPWERDLYRAGERHHNLEAHNDGERGLSKTLIEWARSFNVLHLRSNAVRTFRGASGETYQEALKDILFIFSISHPLEMTLGFIMGATGISRGWDLWLTSLTVAGGSLISIPGFDPGCWFLIGTYCMVKPRWVSRLLTPYRWVVRGGRKIAVYELQLVAKMLGLPALTHILVSPEPRFIEGRIDSVLKDYEHDLTFENPADGSPFLKEVSVKWDEFDSFQSLRRQLSFLGWNVRLALQEIQKLKRKGKLDVLADRFYVEAVEDDGDRLKVRFRDDMIHVGKKLRIRSLREMKRVGCQTAISFFGTT